MDGCLGCVEFPQKLQKVESSLEGVEGHCIENLIIDCYEHMDMVKKFRAFEWDRKGDQAEVRVEPKWRWSTSGNVGLTC